MKNKFVAFAVCCVYAAISLSGCGGGDKKTAPISINFKATYGDAPFVSFKNYEYLDGKKVFFNLFQYFISNVELVRADGSTEKLTDVEYVNLAFDNDGAASAGKTITFNNIEEGVYTGLRLGIGVPENVNNKNPNSLPASSPLTVNGGNEFWSGWKSYIFLKIEGRYDADGDNNVFEKSLEYHCGSNAVYRNLTFTKPITVAAAGSTELFLSADIAKLLRDNGQKLDLVTFSRTSDDANDIVVATKVMNNVSTAFEIK